MPWASATYDFVLQPVMTDARRRAAQRPASRPPVVDRAEPEPGPGEVLVRVDARRPITPLDLLCASGTSYFGVPRTPYVPGVQGVGTVDGQAVWFPMSAGMAPGDGSMAERPPSRRPTWCPARGGGADRDRGARAVRHRGATWR